LTPGKWSIDLAHEGSKVGGLPRKVAQQLDHQAALLCAKLFRELRLVLPCKRLVAFERFLSFAR
jgi:hypothetical protein